MPWQIHRVTLFNVLGIVVLVLLQSCDKDPIYIDYSRGGELQLIHKNDGVQFLAVNDTHCLFDYREALMRYTLWNKTFTNYNWSNSNIGRIVGMGRDKQDRLYVADATYGVGYFENDAYQTVMSKDGLADFDITGNFIVRVGSNVIFNATATGHRRSIWRFHPGKTCLAAYDGRGYVGTESGLYRYHGTSAEGVFNKNTGLKDSHIKDLAVHKNHLFVLTNLGLSEKYNANDFNTYDLPDGVFGNRVFVCHDKVFITTNHGVFWLNDDEIVAYEELNQQFNEGVKVNVLQADKTGTLWVGTSEGLYTYTPL